MHLLTHEFRCRSWVRTILPARSLTTGPVTQIKADSLLQRCHWRRSLLSDQEVLHRRHPPPLQIEGPQPGRLARRHQARPLRLGRVQSVTWRDGGKEESRLYIQQRRAMTASGCETRVHCNMQGCSISIRHFPWARHQHFCARLSGSLALAASQTLWPSSRPFFSSRFVTEPASHDICDLE